jgi:hypothetical protein
MAYREGHEAAARTAKRVAGARLLHHENSLLKMLNRPQVWTLNILAWLILLPSVSRKALEAFDCVELLGKTYLRVDPAIRCDDDEYRLILTIASGGVLFGCVLAPLLILWHTTRKHASPERVSRARVALLTYSYQDKFHYWEAVDLTRKLLLTSVVLLVGPDTILQLWFAAATGLTFLVLHIGFAPYQDEASGLIQLAALVQLEFTYVTGALFFDRKPKELQGEALLVANCLVVLPLVVTGLRSIKTLGVELRELKLTFVDDKAVVQLPVFNDKFATHLCAARLPILARPTQQVSTVADPLIAGTSRTIGSGRKTSAACSRACCTRCCPHARYTSTRTTRTRTTRSRLRWNRRRPYWSS